MVYFIHFAGQKSRENRPHGLEFFSSDCTYYKNLSPFRRSYKNIKNNKHSHILVVD